MSLRAKIRGTIETLFQLGIGGPQWKANSGNIDARDSGDAAYVNVRGDDPVIDDDLVTLRYFDSNAGAVPVDFNASESTSQTTSTTYTLKVNLNFTADAADYIIWWYVEDYTSHSPTRVDIRVELDNTTTLGLVDDSPDSKKTTGFSAISGYQKVTLTAGSHDVDMDFASTKSGKVVRVRRARLVAFKVS